MLCPYEELHLFVTSTTHDCVRDGVGVPQTLPLAFPGAALGAVAIAQNIPALPVAILENLFYHRGVVRTKDAPP